MKKRCAVSAAWLILAGLMYFFENNTGTRIVLACSLLLPFVPRIRHGLFGRDESAGQPRPLTQTVRTFADREEEGAGDVRAYLPGDPVNRIHWKLSAKRDELLVRGTEQEREAEETEKKTASEDALPARDRAKKRMMLTGLSAMLGSLILLFAFPSARHGMMALLNRLFEASEAVNAYVYDRFPVPAGQSALFAAILLTIIAFSLTGIALLNGKRLPVLCLTAGCVLFQIYFGLSFPAWVNVPLFALSALWMMKRPLRQKNVLPVLAGILAVSLAVFFLWPGVDGSTEAASEAVRDALSRMTQSVAGAVRETPAGENETRRVHTRSLTSGEEEAKTEREFRLVTVEEELISMPRWVNYLRIILLLLLTVGVVVLPFLPFALLNLRRKKALEARKAFESANVREAVFAIFQHITAWLEAAGYGGGNLPYAQWRAELSPGYAERFAACEQLFEEAAYSTHEMREEQRQQALELLKETEQMLRQADRKTRLRLRYRECLWI